MDVDACALLFFCSNCPMRKHEFDFGNICIKANGFIRKNYIVTSGASLLAHFMLKHEEMNVISLLHGKKMIGLKCLRIASYLLQNRGSSFSEVFMNEGFVWSSARLEFNLKSLFNLKADCEVSLMFDGSENLSFTKAVFAASSLIVFKLCESKVPTTIPVEIPSIGQKLMSMYSPFHCMDFYNSWAVGHLCNVFQWTLGLVDLRLATGSEGAPVFTFIKGDRKTLVGIIICGLSLKKSEQFSGYSLMCLFSSITCPLDELKFVDEDIKAPSSIALPIDINVKGVVRVDTLTRRGSGVIISNDGLILTCAHVVNFGEDKLKHFVVVIGAKYFIADLLFTTPRNHPCELAILQTRSSSREEFIVPVQFASKTPSLGEKVYSLGFDLINTEKPNITPGIMSKETQNYVYTSCLVFQGRSGGPIFNRDGKLIGILICTYTNDRHYIYPYLNRSLKHSLFEEQLKNYIRTRV